MFLILEARDVLGKLHSGVSPSVAACGFSVSENSILKKVSLNRNTYNKVIYRLLDENVVTRGSWELKPVFPWEQ